MKYCNFTRINEIYFINVKYMFVESLKFLCNSQIQGEENNFIYLYG